MVYGKQPISIVIVFILITTFIQNVSPYMDAENNDFNV